jgi:antitoxin HigA-1
MMAMNPNRITTAPGEILHEEYMKPLALSANKLAAALHVPANRISAIINGTRGITADTAMRLGRYFNTTAEFWLNLQTTHDLTKAQAEVGAEIERRVRPRAA